MELGDFQPPPYCGRDVQAVQSCGGSSCVPRFSEELRKCPKLTDSSAACLASKCFGFAFPKVKRMKEHHSQQKSSHKKLLTHCRDSDTSSQKKEEAQAPCFGPGPCPGPPVVPCLSPFLVGRIPLLKQTSRKKLVPTYSKLF